MSLTFAEPAWLLGLLLAPVLAWMALRWFGAMSRARRVSAAIARTLLLALLLGMLAGASAVRTSDRLAVVLVVDVSESVRMFAPVERGPGGSSVGVIERVRAWIDEALRGRGADDLAGLVLFDGRVSVAAAPSLGDPLTRWVDVGGEVGSDLGGAIRRGASLVPPDAAGRIVLISDGNDTAGAIESALAALSQGGRQIPVDVLAIEYEVEREVVVERVDAPSTSVAGAPVVVRVLLRSTGEATGTLRLLRDGEVVDLDPESAGSGRRVRVRAGLHTELVRVPELPAGRLHRFEAIFEPDVGAEGEAIGDTVASNNRGEAFTLTPGAGSVLIVDGVGSGGDLLARTLREEGLRVEEVPAESMPADMLGLQEHDLIVLQNVPAEAMGSDRHALLSAYVRDLGGGLVMIGGPDSFGAGGWKGTAIEEILPVRLDLPEKAVMPEAAIVFVLDSSGSMSWSVLGSARTKQQIANEAAALAVKTLDKKDLVGIVSFSSGASLAVPLSENSDPDRTVERVLSIGSGGGTNLAPALDLAGSQLDTVDAKLKHVIVLTDGRSQNAEDLPERAQRLRERGIRVTTIGVGEDADAETLDRMAALGGGTFHLVMNPSVLPRVFVRAVRVIRQPLIREQPFVPVVTPSGSPLTMGIGQPPALGGLVLTQAREEASAVVAMRTPQGEPVLAHWNVELGRVVAFTSDAHGEWSRAWADWPGYRTFWTQIVNRTARAPQDGRFDLVLREEGGRLRVRVEAFESDGSPRDLLTMPATLYVPGGESLEISLSQSAPGVYEASVPAGREGGYVAVVKPRAGSARLTPIIAGVSVASGSELRRLSSDADLLHAIASATGGRVLRFDDAEAAALFDRSGIEQRRAIVPIWRSLLVWAIVVLLLDVGTRRVAWDRLIGREFGGDLREMAREAVEQRGERAGRLLARLRGVRPHAEPAPGATLDERDALDLARRELLARRDARLGAVRAAREKMQEARSLAEDADAGPARRPIDAARRSAPATGPRGEHGPTPRPETQPGDGERSDEGTSGLLAAKRRARERFGGEHTP